MSMLPLDLVLHHLANTKLHDRRTTGGGVANCVRIGGTYRKKLSFFNIPLHLNPEGADFRWVRHLDIRRTNKTMVIMRFGKGDWMRTTLRIYEGTQFVTYYSGVAYEENAEFRLGSYDHMERNVPQEVIIPFPEIVY